MTHTGNHHHKVHEGRNIKRFREMRQMKQDALAAELGDDWNQQKISLLEQKETIEPALLQQIAGALNIPMEALQHFEEEQAVNIIANTFHEGSVANAGTANINCTFNPLDKLMETLEENKKLYERLLQAEQEKVALLERMLKER